MKKLLTLLAMFLLFSCEEECWICEVENYELYTVYDPGSRTWDSAYHWVVSDSIETFCIEKPIDNDTIKYVCELELI